MPNRITSAINAKTGEIEQRITTGIATRELVEIARRALDMDIAEHAKFQELKSLAMLNGIITEKEAQTIYVCLSETVSTFNRQPVAVKAVLTGLFRELLEQRLNRDSS
jgi:hypothetical protein